MGLYLAKGAYAQWSGIIKDRPLHALVIMCLRVPDPVPDATEPPAYWAGWAYLAENLGCDLMAYDDTSDEANRLRRNAQRTVERAVSTLHATGAIERVNTARPGKQAKYALHVQPVHNPPTRQPNAPP